MSSIAEITNEEESKSDINFFEISKRKLLIMSMGTLGFYSIYWFYKNWVRYNQRESANTWPLARTIFSIFFMHSLCSKLEVYHKEKTGDISRKLNEYATLYVLLFLTIFIPEPSGLVLQIISSTILLIASISGYTYILMKLQNIVNIANGEKSEEVNDKLTGTNFAWLALGALIYLSYFGSLITVFLMML